MEQPQGRPPRSRRGFRRGNRPHPRTTVTPCRVACRYAGRVSPPTLSIVIPLAPAETGWRGLVETLAADAPELILSAAGAEEPDLPARVTWLGGPAGRARQLNRGAAAAGGDWLWFLHADSRLSPPAVRHVLDFIAQSPPAIGYCRLRFDRDGPAATRLNAAGANLRSRLLGLPYGDQGLCLPRAEFHRLGGFDAALERGEDLDLVVRARAAGLRMKPMGLTLTTSARRYRENGWWTTTWHHQLAAWRLVRNARQKSRSDRAG